MTARTTHAAAVKDRRADARAALHAPFAAQYAQHVARLWYLFARTHATGNPQLAREVLRELARLGAKFSADYLNDPE